MGNRAQVKINSCCGAPVYFYTHDGGSLLEA